MTSSTFFCVPRELNVQHPRTLRVGVSASSTRTATHNSLKRHFCIDDKVK